MRTASNLMRSSSRKAGRHITGDESLRLLVCQDLPDLRRRQRQPLDDENFLSCENAFHIQSPPGLIERGRLAQVPVGEWPPFVGCVPWGPAATFTATLLCRLLIGDRGSNLQRRIANSYRTRFEGF